MDRNSYPLISEIGTGGGGGGGGQALTDEREHLAFIWKSRSGEFSDRSFCMVFNHHDCLICVGEAIDWASGFSLFDEL